jgi:hypothetical protein
MTGLLKISLYAIPLSSCWKPITTAITLTLLHTIRNGREQLRLHHTAAMTSATNIFLATEDKMKKTL